MTESKGRLAAVTGKDVSIDPAAHYDGWATSYDTDLLNGYGYSAHKLAADGLIALDPVRAAPVADIGCGTGLVGVLLAEAGFAAVDGIDVSQGMLQKAAETGAYRALHCRDAGAGLPDLEGAYGAVISAGAFGLGHLGPEALRVLVRLARPGGAIAIFMNAEPFVDQGYHGHLDRLAADNLCTVIDVRDHNYMAALDRPGKLILARRTV